MKYIFITYNGFALPIAYELQQEVLEVVVGQVKNVKVCRSKYASAGSKRDNQTSLFSGLIMGNDPNQGF